MFTVKLQRKIHVYYPSFLRNKLWKKGGSLCIHFVMFCLFDCHLKQHVYSALEEEVLLQSGSVSQLVH